MKEPNSELSVVMCVYNAAPFVSDAIGSILGQSYDDFEFIIVNDGSTDESLHVIEQWAERDERIILIDQDRRGQCAAHVGQGGRRSC